MMDAHSRTRYGFQSLVEREWIALGHRFRERCCITYSKDAEQASVSLHFIVLSVLELLWGVDAGDFQLYFGYPPPLKRDRQALKNDYFSMHIPPSTFLANSSTAYYF